jgi:hypothetical protein
MLALASLCATNAVRVAPAYASRGALLTRGRASLTMGANPVAKFKTSKGDFSAELLCVPL